MDIADSRNDRYGSIAPIELPRRLDSDVDAYHLFVAHEFLHGGP